MVQLAGKTVGPIGYGLMGMLMLKPYLVVR